MQTALVSLRGFTGKDFVSAVEGDHRHLLNADPDVSSALMHCKEILQAAESGNTVAMKFVDFYLKQAMQMNLSMMNKYA